MTVSRAAHLIFDKHVAAEAKSVMQLASIACVCVCVYVCVCVRERDREREREKERECVYIYMYIYIYVSIHIYIYTCSYIHIHTQPYALAGDEQATPAQTHTHQPAAAGNLPAAFPLCANSEVVLLAYVLLLEPLFRCVHQVDSN